MIIIAIIIVTIIVMINHYLDDMVDCPKELQLTLISHRLAQVYFVISNKSMRPGANLGLP